MSEPRVTITLGRSGQVVKRGGSKRFIGSDGFPSDNKRLREDDIKWRHGDRRFDEPGIAQKDLRLKLLRKRHAKEQRKMEQHVKLSKAVQLPARANMLQREPQPEGSSLLRQHPSKEILGDIHPEESSRKYYSSPNMNGLRFRSPHRVWTTSRGLSPPRTFSDPRQVPSTWTANVSRTGPFLSKEAVDSSRQTTLIPLKATAETVRPAVPIGGVMLKSSHMVVEPLNVASLLHSLGLGKYAITFQAEEVDMTALKQMSDKDLKELGIPMGPRKKILLALQPRPKRQPPQP